MAFDVSVTHKLETLEAATAIRRCLTHCHICCNSTAHGDNMGNRILQNLNIHTYPQGLPNKGCCLAAVESSYVKKLTLGEKEVSVRKISCIQELTLKVRCDLCSRHTLCIKPTDQENA